MLRSVLLIDDSEIDNFVHRRILELANMAETTVTHTSPVQALSYLRELNQTPSLKRPDLIFLDINMPYMDGFEFLRQLEMLHEDEFYPHVVMLSSSIDERDVERARSHWSVLKFIHKPLTVDALQGLELHAQVSKVPLRAIA